MTVRSHELTQEPIRWNKLIAVVIWVLGVGTTYVVVADLGLGGVLGIAVALLVQLVLTRLESPAWRGERNMVAYAAVALDTLVNIGGTWTVVKELHTVTPVRAISEMFGAGVGPVTGVIAFAVCSVLGLLLAAAPETIWND
jgi:hypothetical protein